MALANRVAGLTGRKGVSDVFLISTRRRPLPSKCLSVKDETYGTNARLNGFQKLNAVKNSSRRFNDVILSQHRRKRTSALRGRNRRRENSEWAGKSVSTAVNGCGVFVSNRDFFVPPMPEKILAEGNCDSKFMPATATVAPGSR